MTEPNTEQSAEATSLKERVAVIIVLAEGVQVPLALKGSLDIEEALELVGFKHCAVYKLRLISKVNKKVGKYSPSGKYLRTFCTATKLLMSLLQNG